MGGAGRCGTTAFVCHRLPGPGGKSCHWRTVANLAAHGILSLLSRLRVSLVRTYGIFIAVCRCLSHRSVIAYTDRRGMVRAWATGLRRADPLLAAGGADARPSWPT